MGEEGGYELNSRERLWRQQMHAMRKRVERDPYEAVFGKRFEPFWSPLVPSWMREEMGLPVWQAKDFSKPADPIPSNAAPTNKDLNGKLDDMSELIRKDREFTRQKLETDKKMGKESNKTPSDSGKAVERPVEPNPTQKPTAYSYAFSSSWDSWTNKTKRVEWDSVSGATRKYEYDPISNRMIQTEAHYPAQTKTFELPKSAVGGTLYKGTSSNATTSTSPDKEVETGAVNIPVKPPPEGRKSIPIPPPLSQPSYNVPMGFQPKPTSVGPLKSTAIAQGVPRPAALTAFPEKATSTEIWKADNDLASLTAEEVRAGMAKLKPIPRATSTVTSTSPPPPATNPQQQGEQDFSSLDAQPHIDALLKRREAVAAAFHRVRQMSEWDQAEMDVILQRELESLQKKREKLMKDEKGLFHIERQKREVEKLDQRIRAVGVRIARLDGRIAGEAEVQPDNSAEVVEGAADTKSAAGKVTPAILQSSLDRMQTKDSVSPKADLDVDADDAAAHESTEPLPATAAANVPEQWSQQADLLQADRVKRTVAKIPYADMRTLITDSTSTSRGRDVADPALLHQPTSSDSKAGAAEQSPTPRKVESSHYLGRRVLRPLNAESVARVASLLERYVDADVLRGVGASREQMMAKMETEVKDVKSRMEAHEGRFVRHHLGTGPGASMTDQMKKASAAEQPIEPAARIRESIVNIKKRSVETADAKISGGQEASEVMKRWQERYAAKVKALRGELETAYKQSTVHSEKHLERIAELEAALKAAEKASRVSEMERGLKDKYAAKMRAMRAELDTAYKQSTVHSEKHLERIRELQAQLEEARKALAPSGYAAASTTAAPELTQAEGDVSADVAKFAGTEKWYKQPATTPQSIKREMEKAELKRKDRELVKEVRRIYEDAYGVIGSEKEQKRKEAEDSTPMKELMKKRKGVVEVESDVDLGEALAKYETDMKGENVTMGAQRTALVEELKGRQRQMAAAMERAAHEGPKAVGAETAIPGTAPAAAVVEAGSAIPWAEPPLYQILAYDSGNDRISSATTTSNFAGATEEPVSIPKALSQLYAPTKFVTELAELQGKGWLVVHAGREVLVFRKVDTETKPSPTEPAAQNSEPTTAVPPAELTHTPDPGAEQPDYVIRHYPRVKREEYPVFTGQRRKWQGFLRTQLKRERKRRARRWRWVIGSGLTFAGVAYVVGSVEERGRGEAEKRRKAEAVRRREG